MGKKKSMQESEDEIELNALDGEDGDEYEDPNDQAIAEEIKAGKHGKPIAYDANFKGPLDKRRCHDVPCLLIFIAYMVGMAIVAGFGFKNGDPRRLLTPTDSNGRLCGQYYGSAAHLDLRNKNSLMILDITQCAVSGISNLPNCADSLQVCVATCPDTLYVNLVSGGSLTAALADPYCDYLVTPTDNSELQTAIDNEQCPPYLVPSIQMLGRCVPDLSVFVNMTYQAGSAVDIVVSLSDLQGYVSIFYNVLNSVPNADKVLQDLQAGWGYIAAGCALALLLCYVWLFLLNYIAGYMVYISMLATLAGSAAVAILGYIEWKQAQIDNATNPQMWGSLNVSQYQEWTYLGLAIAACIVFVVVLLLFIFFMKRIRIAVRVVKEAAKATRSMPFLGFWPLVVLLLQFAWLAYFVFVGAYLVTSGTPTYFNTSTSLAPCSTPGGDCVFNEYSSDLTLKGMILYHLFGFFWTLNLVSAWGQIVIAGAIAGWYWTRDKSTVKSPITNSVKRAFFYHMGSLALGSFIIAVIQTVRVLLEYVARKTHARRNMILKWVICIVQCCLWCLEKLIKYLNRNAYIEIAVYGYGFCRAAWRAFKLLARNILRAIAVDRVGAFVIFMSKLAMTAITGFLAYYFFRSKQAEYNYYLVPVIIIGIFAWFCALVVFSSFDMAIDTVFLCFLEDLERNDGSDEKPYYMAKQLQNLAGKKPKKKKKDASASEVDADKKKDKKKKKLSKSAAPEWTKEEKKGK